MASLARQTPISARPAIRKRTIGAGTFPIWIRHLRPVCSANPRRSCQASRKIRAAWPVSGRRRTRATASSMPSDGGKPSAPAACASNPVSSAAGASRRPMALRLISSRSAMRKGCPWAQTCPRVKAVHLRASWYGPPRTRSAATWTASRSSKVGPSAAKCLKRSMTWPGQETASPTQRLASCLQSATP